MPDRLSGEVEELRRRWAEVDAERRRLLAENNSLRNSWSQACRGEGELGGGFCVCVTF